MQEVADSLGADVAVIRQRAEDLSEANPMLGHRGCRLGIAYPEIYEMQARAIFEGALLVAAPGDAPQPEIMIPLVGTRREPANPSCRRSRIGAAPSAAGSIAR